MNWYIGCFKKYADFSGRARREEFWMFCLFNAIAGIVLTVLDCVLGARLFTGLYNLAVILPSIAVMARRLHDTNRSGWLQLVALIPLAGFIILLYFACCDSQPGENRYGANPKGM